MFGSRKSRRPFFSRVVGEAFALLALLPMGLVGASVSVGFLSLTGSAAAEPDELLFGDTHLHSSNSFDAYLNRNYSADPATAYRYAQGFPVIHPYHRARVQIETPLDFLVVSDHAEYLGVMRHIIERGIPDEGLSLSDWVRALYVEYWLGNVIENDEGMTAFASLLPEPSTVEEAAANPPASAIPNSELMQKTVWLPPIVKETSSCSSPTKAMVWCSRASSICPVLSLATWP